MQKTRTQQVAALKTDILAEETAKLAIESAELGVYEIDLVSNDIVTDSRFNTIFGLKSSVSWNDYTAAFLPEDIHVRNVAYNEALLTGHLHYEARIMWPDKTLHWIKISGIIFYNEHLQPVKLLGVAMDITKQKEFSVQLERLVEDKTKDLIVSNQKLQLLNGELQQYVQVSSHDFQEPLRKIRTYAEMIMLRDFDKLSEKSKTNFNKITAAATRLSNSLKDLLDFNSVNKEDPYKTVDLNDVIKMAESDLELVIAQKAAVITYPTLPVIRAIPLQMHQLFYNLINNALKFTKEGDHPLIDIIVNSLSSQKAHNTYYLDETKKYVEIIIKDNGIGFDQKNAEKIFDVFYRLHDRKTYSGTGIGLSLCKKVVQNHGGKLWATSTPGEGASFHIILPRD